VGVPTGPTVEEEEEEEEEGGGGGNRVGEQLLTEVLEQRKISWSFRK
jgi:hypothetical protein